MEEGYTQLGTVLMDQRPDDSEGHGVIVIGRFNDTTGTITVQSPR